MSTSLAHNADFYKQDAKEIAEHKTALAKLGCTAATSCQKNLQVGLFFDGTGNNRYIDQPKGIHSNVARLFFLFPPNKEDKGFYRIYLQGVGTPFKEIGEHTKTTLGSALASGGYARISYAFLELFNVISQHLITKEIFNYLALQQEAERTKAKLAKRGTSLPNIEDLSSALCAGMLNKADIRQLEKRLIAQVGEAKLKQIGQINVSIFGFSRGAAEARAFLIHFYQFFPKKTIAGVKINFYFAGLMDTVASVGLAQITSLKILEGHLSWAGNLKITPSMVKTCRHFVALNEVRGCFPLDSMRDVLGKTFTEHAYPGSHSDVGGGYGSDCQGKHDISKVPGRHMYFEARNAGVPLMHLNEIGDNELAELSVKEFTLSPAMIKDFNQFLVDVKNILGTKDIGMGYTGVAPTSKIAKEAMNQYFIHRGVMMKEGLSKQKFYTLSKSADKKYLDQANNHIQEIIENWDITMNQFYTNEGLVPFKIIQAAYKSKSLRDAGITSTLHNFYSLYVHDSVATFISMGIDEFRLNQKGFAKYRNTFY